MTKSHRNEAELDDEKSLIASNSLYYFLRMISRSLIAFIVSIFLVRLLGADNYGVYTIVTSYWGLFLTFTGLGFSSAAVYGIAKYRAKNQYGAVNWITKHYLKLLVLTSLIGSVVMFFVAAPIANAYHSPQIAELMQILAIALVFYSLMENFSLNVYVGFQKIKYSFISGIVFDVLRLFQGSLIVVYFGLIGVIAFYDVIYLIVGLISLYFVYKLLNRNKDVEEKSPGKAAMTELGKYNLFSTISNLIGYIYGPFITLFLGLFSPSLASVSFYTVGSQMAAVIGMPSGALSAAFFATNTKYFEKKQFDNFYRILNVVIRYVAMATIPLAVGSLVAAGPLIIYFYRSSLSAAALPFALIVISTLISSIFSPITNILSAIGKQKYFMYSYAASAVVGLIATIILVPILLQNGAALASLIAMLTMLVVNIYLVSKYIKITLPYVAIAKITFASLIMGLYIYVVDSVAPLSWLPFTLISGLGVYAFVAYIIKALNVKDIWFFMKLARIEGIFKKLFNYQP